MNEPPDEESPEQRPSHPDQPTLKRYASRASRNGVVFGSEYVDWFTDDDDARATYRVIMEEQGYKVKSVTIGTPCIVDIE